MISYILIILLILWVIVRLFDPTELRETFWGQLEDQAPAPTSLDFRSPKSDIMNFNETTELNSVEPNIVKSFNSHLVDPYVPLPTWVYPFTYVNRKFDHILTTLVHKIEKDSNQNQRLHDRPNEWHQPYPYVTQSWDQLPPVIKLLITDVIEEINRRFNMEIPIVGFRRNKIKYHWIKSPTGTETQVLIMIRVYKQYTIDDIKYPIEIDPNINEHLKSNFERDLIIQIDDLDQIGDDLDQTGDDLDHIGDDLIPSQPDLKKTRYHIKYLRFPAIDYQNDDSWDDLMYAKERDNMFYLAKSKDPMYRMLSNTEARDQYIKYIQKTNEKAKYKCFPHRLKGNQVVTQLQDPTLCEQINGLWEKQCETDTNCPYYQRNRHYPNDFGGCDHQTGYCQMPSNVIPLTYRKPANPKKAYCYNCQHGYLGHSSIGQCCQEQGTSPDYMFSNDVGQRRKYADYLRQKGLNWARYQ